MDHWVDLTWTACHFGGRRFWFRCPGSGCGRRVALLYVGDAGMFVCRACLDLAYASQRETADDRATRRAETIRRRLTWAPGIFNGEGPKPLGMHGRTFARSKAEHDAFVQVTLGAAATRLGLTNRPFTDLGDD